MAGLLDVSAAIMQIGKAISAAAADVREATEALKDYNVEASASSNVSSMNSAGGGPSTMGSSAGGPVTANGLSIALKQNQGRL